MRVAADPITGKRITPKQYLEKYVEPFGYDNADGYCPAARCPVCRNELQVIPGSRRGFDVGFRHFPESCPCPMRGHDRQGYQISPERKDHSQNSNELRAVFFSNWRHHWQQFKKYVGHVDITDFIGLLKYADAKGIWYYRGLKEHEVTVLLLLIKDFGPVVSKDQQVLRKHWVRFWFVAPVYNVDEFLSKPESDRVCIKALYYLPARVQVLNVKSLDSFEVLRIKSDYIDSPVAPSVHGYIERRMSQAFGKELYL
jgi:hypothetical protein